ncbi:HAD hydrolase-like protein [Alloscardovia criceti]|uniref:HAD hydrolase-like protein n=1 Tax=Alloscardovia criceti TaxID=356828 RepID=UPI0003753D23|nr:HAD hydrolase-like protein [Alloscardovia criceti]
MSNRRIVLLDLDGTTVESDPGILASVKLTYEHFGKELPSAEELQTFIGPPLLDSFTAHGFENNGQEAVDFFRLSYTKPFFDDPQAPGQLVPGLFLSRMYFGYLGQLQKLREAGYVLAVATAKPQTEAIRLCEHIGLEYLVVGIYGASEGSDTSRLHKNQVIKYAFERLNYNEDDGDRAVMVGDRWTDIDGAHDNGIPAIGAGWGYAAPGEFEAHNCDAVAETVEDLLDTVNMVFNR